MYRLNLKPLWGVCLLVVSTVSININTPSVQAAAGYSLKFGGTGTNYNDRVEIPIINNPELPFDPATNPGNKANIGATDFTIEFWMKADGTQNTPASNGSEWIWGNIILDRDILDNTNHKFGISLHNGNIRFGAGAASATIQTSGVNVADNIWHHVAVTRQIYTGLSQIYIDGAKRAEGNTQSGDISYQQEYGYSNGGYDRPECQGVNKNPYLVLGAEKHDYMYCTSQSNPERNAYNGYLEDLRISSSLKRTSNFSRPELPHTVDVDTVLLYRFDELNLNVGTTILDSAPSPINGIMKSGAVETTEVPWGSSVIPPVAHDDSYTYVHYDSSIGVLVNDENPSGMTMTAVLVTPPNMENLGSFELKPGGNLWITPKAYYSGTVTFTYKACNGSVCSQPATATYILPAEGPEPIANRDAYFAIKNQTLSVAAPGVLGNDMVKTDTPTLTVETQPESGSLVLNQDGSFEYTPNASYISPCDHFIYKIDNGNGSVSQYAWVCIVDGGFAFTPWVTDSNGRTNLPYEVMSAPGTYLQAYVASNNNRIYTRYGVNAPSAGYENQWASNWSTSPDPWEKTTLPITMAGFGNMIYLTHIGTPDGSGRQKIYTKSAYLDAPGPYIASWSSWTKGNDPFEDTKFPIGMAEHNRKLYQVHVGTDYKIYTRSSTDGNTWSGWTKGNDPFEKTLQPVKITSFNGKLYQVHVGTDYKIYTRSSADGVTWSNWTKGNDPYEYTNSTVNIQASAGRLFEVHKGSDDRVYTRISLDGTTWGNWFEEGGSTSLPISMSESHGYGWDRNLTQGMVGKDGKMYWRMYAPVEGVQ